MIKKRFTIEPLNIPADQLEELKEIATRYDMTERCKRIEMLKVTGVCCNCSWFATHILRYKRFGVSVIERYCDECLDKLVIPSIKK